MKNNILGGLVIFMVVVTCLLMLDDIADVNKAQTNVQKTTDVEQVEGQIDLAIIDSEED